MSPQIQTPLRRKHASCSRTVGPDLSIDKRAYLIINYMEMTGYFYWPPSGTMYATSNYSIHAPETFSRRLSDAVQAG